MEYIDQVEKLFKYFECNLGLDLVRSIIKLKRSFNNDYNLIGCFLKDYLMVKNYKKVTDEDDLADEFILYFEQESSRFPKEYLINEIIKYSKYYLSIVFEDFRDSDILIAISTINSCFAIEYYPIFMKILNKFYSHGITERQFKILLESVVDVAIKNFEEFEVSEFSQDELEQQVKKTASNKVYSKEGMLV